MAERAGLELANACGYLSEQRTNGAKEGCRVTATYLACVRLSARWGGR
jgi:hypothetical protein